MERKAECGCGSVTVTVSGDPQTSFACHCDACQKSTGSIATFGVVFREEDVISIEGKRRPALDIRIPDTTGPGEIVQYLSDLLHEYASDRHPRVYELKTTT